MTLTDLINEVKQSRNKVIPTSYILNRLREVERNDNANSAYLGVNAKKKAYDGTGDFWEGVD